MNLNFEIIGIWLIVLMTLSIFSYLVGDNPFYKLAEHIFIGVSAAYIFAITFWDQIYPNLLGRLFPNYINAGYDLDLTYIIPLILGIFMLFRLIPSLSWLSRISIGYIVGKKLFTKYPKYFLLQKSLTFVLGISFFYLFGVEGIIFAIALSYGHFLFIIAKVFRKSSIDFSLLKKHRGFIGNNYFMNVSGAVRSHIDKIIIVPLIGFEILGNYALALQIYAVLMIFSNIIYRYALPHDASGTSTRKIKLIGLSYAVGVSMLGFTILPMIVPQIFEKFNDIGPAIQIISLAIIPTTIGLFYTSQILGREKSSVILASRILGSISIIAMLVVLAPLYGMVGAASAFVLSALVGCVFLVCAEYYRTHNQRN